MSKIGQQPIEIPSGVTVEINGSLISISGPKGKLQVNLSKDLDIKIENNNLTIALKKDNKVTRSLWGTTRMLIANNVKGVTEGWKKQLELVGTGYRSEVAGNTLVLTVGYSHPINIEAPEGITFKVEKSVINVEGIDKQVVGQVSADIRSCRPPEPYKGKGVKYVGEYIRRKAGKAAKAAA
ncbi:MAG: 50S ribosomal protein L6 [Candidatus Woesebacteria bacterium]|nr:50S ribosomal protein L6 [Candidatus Woesebacteria bacterium]